MSLLYAAFGSNLHPRRLRARTPSAAVAGTSVLRGWQLAFHKRGADGSAKADVVPRNGGRVYLALYTMDAFDKTVLDRVEGVGFGYEEHRLYVDDGREVFFYRAQPDAIDPRLDPFSWYLRFVVEGARWHRFPGGYVEEIAKTPTVADPNPARTHENLRILA